MVTDVLLERQAPLPIGALKLQVDRTIEINVSAEEALRKVSRFVHMEISTQMHAETPVLVVGAKTAWRVPIHLTFPSLGDVGCVGFIHVDSLTGTLETSQAIVQGIKHNANDLAIRFTSPATQSG